MEYITTPWREKYIKRAFKMKECIFCRALKQKTDREAYILYRGTQNFIVLNKYPYTPGHLMIAPFKHIASLETSEKESTDELIYLLKLSLKILRVKYNPNGFNTGMNIGQSAGAGITGHYHLHVIPRWVGDSNFMPLISKTKITIEDIETTYEGLSSLFQKERKGGGSFHE